jgi:hypothetical protein
MSPVVKDWIINNKNDRHYSLSSFLHTTLEFTTNRTDRTVIDTPQQCKNNQVFGNVQVNI